MKRKLSYYINCRYHIGEDGRIYSRYTGSKMSYVLSDRGYYQISLNDLVRGKVKRRTFRVHQLVALFYLGPCPRGHEINHKDGNKLNNQLENLEYVTKKQNMQHALKLSLRHYPKGSKSFRGKFSSNQVKRIRNWLKDYTIKQVADQFNTSYINIWNIARGNTYVED